MARYTVQTEPGLVRVVRLKRPRDHAWLLYTFMFAVLIGELCAAIPYRHDSTVLYYPMELKEPVVAFWIWLAAMVLFVPAVTLVALRQRAWITAEEFTFRKEYVDYRYAVCRFPREKRYRMADIGNPRFANGGFEFDYNGKKSRVGAAMTPSVASDVAGKLIERFPEYAQAWRNCLREPSSPESAASSIVPR